MEYVFGIDFGTTSSSVVGCYRNDNNTRIDYFGDAMNRPIPSIVAIDKTTGEIFTGREAWNKKSELGETCECISSVKTILGKEITKTIADKVWTPEDISYELFKSLKESVASKSGFKQIVDLKEAVVAIPVGFGVEKRNILRRAALKAGIYIKSFVSEPTAAFFANYDGLKSASTVAVFDWGGGTLDVSILEHRNGKIYELAKSGRDIAGNYIDEKIARKIHTKLAMKTNNDISFDDMPAHSKDRLLVRVEEAKRKLSEYDSANVMIVSYGNFGSLNEKIEYDWFKEIIRPEVNIAMDCLKEAISQSGIGISNIDKILLVGGSSKLKPLLQQMQNVYGDLLYIPEDPDWNIAEGSSLLSLVSGENYSNQSVGIILSDNTYYELLGKNEYLKGWKQKYRFGITNSNEQAQFVFDGSEDIRSLPDRFRILNVPSYNFLQEVINITAQVDENLVFIVEACSSMKPTCNMRIWSYPNLKCYYKLP